jgi:hypothetical protein
MDNTIMKYNDAFRKTFFGGKVRLGAGVRALSDTERAEVLNRVQTFDEFTKKNDPHGEHDFGAFDLNGKRFAFKIDYYAPGLLRGSENPADLEKTVRVLTIMAHPEILDRER